MALTRSARKRNAQRPCALLKLPRELRDQIYRIILFGEDKQGQPEQKRWYRLTVHKTFHAPPAVDFKPSLEIRQSCRQLRHEVDETISHHARLFVITDLVCLPSDKSFMPMPKVLLKLVTDVQLMVCICDFRLRDTSTLTWLKKLSSSREVLVNIVTARHTRWSRQTHELRTLVADIFSFVPKVARVRWWGFPEDDDNSDWITVPESDFIAVAKQMHLLQGCFHEMDKHVCRKRKREA